MIRSRLPVKSSLVSLVTLWLAAMGPAGCGPQTASELYSQDQPIYYGDPDNSQAHMATVALDLGGGLCSGTLIAPDVVMSAAHCLDGVSPTNIQVRFGTNYNSPTATRNVSQGIQNPNWNSRTLEYDMSLLRLSQPAPASITPIPHLPAALGLTQADVGSTPVDFSGFGLDENGNLGVKLHVSDTIDTICDSTNGCGNVVYHAFGYDQQPGGPCNGDSGGPAYVVRSGTEYVAGVTSYGDQNCSQFGVSTNVDRYSAWIDDFIGVVYEICTNGTDDDDDGLVDCDDPDCANAPTCLPGACDDPPTLGCGDAVGGTTSGGSQVFTNYSCLADGTENGPEVAYRLDVAAGTEITVDMQPGAGGDLDLFLLSAAGDGCDPASCVTGSVESEPNPEHIVASMPAGGAYLVIETWDTPTSFQLQLSCSGAGGELCGNGVDDDGDGAVDCADSECRTDPGCNACLAARPLFCGDQVSGTTQGGWSQFGHNSCIQGQETGPEVAYELHVPSGVQFTANMQPGAGGDLDLFLMPPAAGGCNTDGCLDASLEYNQDPEQIVASMPAGGAYLVVETYDNPTTFSLRLDCSGQYEICANHSDDDGDGLADCADPDCADHPECQQTPEICNNGSDDDGDGQIDCADGDCVNAANCQQTPENCANGTDDDGDGQIDCADADCAGDANCQPTPENCTNGLDDDGDAQIDCDDLDCSSAPTCQPTPEDCSNGTDDDGDGQIDCDDLDCSTAPACQPVSENCTNGIDDDGDGQIDCADSDCANDASCSPRSEICNNGQDDDGDGDFDCADNDCISDAACATPDDSSNGCGCAQTGSRGPAGLALVFLLGLWAMRRRG